MTAALNTSLEQVGEVMTPQDDSDALALAALQAHYGDRQIRNLERRERQDYTGSASNKVRVGGALVVECWALTGDEFTHDRYEINDKNRPFDEPTIAALGADAPIWIRDIPVRE